MKNRYEAKNKNFDIAILAIALAISLIFCVILVSFSYFSASQTKKGIIALGEVDFSIMEQGSGSLIALPNTSIERPIKVGNYRNSDSSDYKNLAEIFVRFTVQAYIDGALDDFLLDKISFDNGQFYKDNNTYYYCGELQAGQEIYLFNHINFSDIIENNYQQKQFKLILNIDAVQAQNNAYKEVWPDYPTAWENTIKN